MPEIGNLGELQPRTIEGKVERPVDRFTVNEITKGSTVMSLEAALAIQVEKIKPTGYNEASGFFRDQYGKTTDAQCVWFMVEAKKAEQLDKMKQEFPDVETRAKRILKHMQSPDYSPEQVRTLQEEAAKAFEILFNCSSRFLS